MVSTIKRWLKKWLEVDVLEQENLILAKALKRHEENDKIFEEGLNQCLADCKNMPDIEVRIAFLENSLTAKPTTAKIVPKTANWKQFRTAAEKASESEQENA